MTTTNQELLQKLQFVASDLILVLKEVSLDDEVVAQDAFKAALIKFFMQELRSRTESEIEALELAVYCDFEAPNRGRAGSTILQLMKEAVGIARERLLEERLEERFSSVLGVQ